MVNAHFFLFLKYIDIYNEHTLYFLWDEHALLIRGR